WPSRRRWWRSLAATTLTKRATTSRTICSGSSVILVGFMATGKSSVGRALADRLGLEFLDTDEVVEQRLGKSIAAIFAEEGETVFRAAEREAIAETMR